MLSLKDQVNIVMKILVSMYFKTLWTNLSLF